MDTHHNQVYLFVVGGRKNGGRWQIVANLTINLAVGLVVGGEHLFQTFVIVSPHFGLLLPGDEWRGVEQDQFGLAVFGERDGIRQSMSGTGRKICGQQDARWHPFCRRYRFGGGPDGQNRAGGFAEDLFGHGAREQQKAAREPCRRPARRAQRGSR